MSPSELDSFMATTMIQTPLSSTKLPQRIGGIDYLQQATGWKLNPTISYLAGEKPIGIEPLDLNEQTVFIDTSDPDEYVVYLTTKVNWL
jgi:hypothetical protein